jgi:hypothetical protein
MSKQMHQDYQKKLIRSIKYESESELFHQILDSPIALCFHQGNTHFKESNRNG